ncbi:pyridoxal phosphate-dependent transferase [Aspergillus pseudonomiae]|uniref:Pyridoxal phosphate-dependent transferase n=1 Tax=Aspergillus pseudonomiae TaxID=1506151 RepID=A0A5N7DMJ8_9EURO|nr:pyridoxal phosphate-dependent transferase [Aspergillus pseudonomiae]KAE8406708.1 pyridoxal phosphate-dependent transferase [Aspergillus pseudonomiae]
MSEFHREEHIDAAILQHHLSRRAAENFEYRDVWGPREKSMANPWSPENPDGTIILRLAENSLLHDEMGQLIKEQITVLPLSHLTYSTGPRGSRRLRRAAAAFLNEEFHSRQTITQDNIFITPGLASAIDALTWAICNDGDGILIPQPYYNGFDFDVLNRSNGRVIGVKYEGVEGFSGLDDLFRPDVNKRALEVALREAKKNGITIRALIISNPHNPLGRCYPPETLLEFAAFCGRNKLHFISDEIYAKSVFPNTAMPSPTPFVSALSLDLRDVIDPTLMHVLYGASKDFCANGLRLGVVCTINEGLIGAMSSISMFSWSPHVLQDRIIISQRPSSGSAGLATTRCEFRCVNAGLFIWVDLRHLLIPKSLRQQTDYSELRTASPEASMYRQREQKFADICAQNGLMITPGSVYAAEEFGWFRLTFTVGKNALEEGLKRLEKSLSTAETDMQF